MQKTKVLIVVVLSLIFIISAYIAFSGIIFNIEKEFNLLLNSNKNNSVIMKFFTTVGEVGGVVIVTAFFMLLPKTRKRVGTPLSVTVIFSWFLCTVVKYSVRRERPLFKLLEVGGFSFPSGHAMNNAALYIALMILLLKMCATKVQKTAVCIICVTIPFAVGVSRMYFNVHYFTDVVCGWCLGSIIAVVITGLYFNYTKRNGLRE